VGNLTDLALEFSIDDVLMRAALVFLRLILAHVRRGQPADVEGARRLLRSCIERTFPMWGPDLSACASPNLRPRGHPEKEMRSPSERVHSLRQHLLCPAKFGDIEAGNNRPPRVVGDLLALRGRLIHHGHRRPRLARASCRADRSRRLRRRRPPSSVNPFPVLRTADTARRDDLDYTICTQCTRGGGLSARPGCSHKETEGVDERISRDRAPVDAGPWSMPSSRCRARYAPHVVVMTTRPRLMLPTSGLRGCHGRHSWGQCRARRACRPSSPVPGTRLLRRKRP